jgi:hypothetical protein
MSFNFVVDRCVKDKAYPALARWQANPYTPEWRQFIQHWPYTVPADLYDHCQAHGFPYQLRTVKESYNQPSFYPIAIGWFDFKIDYFDLLDNYVFEQLLQKNLRVLFYYDEGDNPYLIKQRLDNLCQQHELSTDCYRFISANTAADCIENFVYFAGDELLYWLRNQDHPATGIHTRPRQREFTALSRTHKWWRATAMADLYRNTLLANSYWSYSRAVDVDDQFKDNPIEIDTLNIRDFLQTFIAGAPYACDALTTDQHNDHSLLVAKHFNDSYCSIILETHFDADGSGGAFLTEKTFKCIKHGHPFIVIGAPGSLATLRSLGYRTFDHCIDNSYDLETNNTRRWQKIMAEIQQIKSQNMHSWFLNCIDDLKHNQELFLNSKFDRLNNLHDKLLY